MDSKVGTSSGFKGIHRAKSGQFYLIGVGKF